MKFKKVYIEITNLCNLNCSFCAKNQRMPKQMSKAEFHHILKEIKPYTKYIYLHVLGEPLLHPELHEFLLLARLEGFYVNMTSNGVLLPQRFDDIVGLIRQLNLSLHSYPLEQGCHSDTYLQDCLTYGDRLAQHGTYISYRFWNQRNRMMDEESQAMIKTILSHYAITNGTFENQKLASRRFLHFEEQFTWPSRKQPVIAQRGTCYGLRQQCAILVDGSVVPCCLDSLGECTLGNVFDTPLKKILESAKATQIIKGFQQGYLIEDLCQRCGFRTKFDMEESI